MRQRAEQARWLLGLSPHGWGWWRDLTCNGESAFEWSSEDERQWLFEASPSAILARVESLRQTPGSDIAFARIFASQSDEERLGYLRTWKHGNWNELRRVLRLALLSQEELWRCVSGVTWELDLSREPKPYLRAGRLHSPRNGEVPSELPSLKEALTRVLNWFAPTPDVELERKHLSLERLARSRSTLLSIEEPQPSAHDRLEAMLEWRSWLKETGA